MKKQIRLTTDDQRLTTRKVHFFTFFSFAFCLLSLVFGLWSAPPAAAGDWLDDANGYARGRDQAGISRQPMLIYFYTDWCPYCAKFERFTLANPEVQKVLAGYVKVRINPEKGSRESKLADQYKAKSYPSVYFEHPSTRQKTHEITSSVKSPHDFAIAANKFLEVSKGEKLIRIDKESQKLAAEPKVTAKAADIPRPTEPAEQTLYLKNGRSIKGKMVSETDKGVSFLDWDLGEVYFSRAEIDRIEKNDQSKG